MPLFCDTKEGRLFAAKLSDDVFLSKKRREGRFTPFLDERQLMFARSFLKNEDVTVLFWGGFEDAQRLCAGIFPDEDGAQREYFDIEPITAVWYRDERSLSHRDVLGTLMALGIKRECVGDILVEEGRCVFFVKSDVADFVLTQMDRIGGVAVKLSSGFDGPLPVGVRFQQISSTVASARLDCIVKALVSSGRDDAAALIKAGKVTLDCEETDNVSKVVHDGAVIAVRGCGKFIIDSVGPQTRKGRLALTARKYI